MVALPGSHDYELYQGSVWRRVVRYVDEDSGAPIDLTGYTARFTARRERPHEHELIVEIDTSAGITIDGPAGELVLKVDATTTATLPAGQAARYGLVLTPPSGPADAFALLTGALVIRPRVEPEGA